jgi:hypothetical protein
MNKDRFYFILILWGQISIGQQVASAIWSLGNSTLIKVGGWMALGMGFGFGVIVLRYLRACLRTRNSLSDIDGGSE